MAQAIEDIMQDIKAINAQLSHAVSVARIAIRRVTVAQLKRELAYSRTERAWFAKPLHSDAAQGVR